MPPSLTVGEALARAEQHLGRSEPDQAVQLCRQVLRADPENPYALHMLAVVANQSGRPDRALEIVERALRIRPDDPALRNTLGLILTRLGRLDAAEAEFRRSLAGDPGQKQAVLNLAVVMDRRSDPRAAHTLLSSLEDRIGADADTHALRAVILQSEGAFETALDQLDAALLCAPDNTDIRFARSNLLLLLGRMEEGWPDFELRRNRRLGRAPPVDRPVWSGRVKPGERVLVYAEHGLGDTIQFARYLPHLHHRGVDATFFCYRSLLPLMRCLGISDRLVADDGPPPDCDAVAPLMSLPRILGHGVPEITALGVGVPYLRPDAPATRKLKAKLDVAPGLKVGLAWQGNPHQSTDPDRSIPIDHFGAVIGLPGVTSVSLQLGFGEHDIDVFKKDHPVLDWPEEKTGLDATANLIAALDLVITSDTAIAHLAGALGAPVWLLLSAKPSWRWLLERADSPWYPTMRLFRQHGFRDWTPVFAAVTAALAERLGHGDDGGGS